MITKLRFISDDDASATDIVSSLVGVTSALDFGGNYRDEQHDADVTAGLATAARVLAVILQDRLET